MKQTEKTGLTVSRILDAATLEFGRNGYVGGTVNNICKSGINKGLIYHNFRDKDALYLACLKRACEKLLALIEESGAGTELLQYMKIRMRFFEESPEEAHIFFEALLQPQEKLLQSIRQILQPIEEINESIYRRTLSSVRLRDGITQEDALRYFRQMQRMFNAYFGSPAYRSRALDEQIREHETNLPKLLDFMLYGIAKGGAEK